jgi:hypothetical protein
MQFAAGIYQEQTRFTEIVGLRILDRTGHIQAQRAGLIDCEAVREGQLADVPFRRLFFGIVILVTTYRHQLRAQAVKFSET